MGNLPCSSSSVWFELCSVSKIKQTFELFHFDHSDFAITEQLLTCRYFGYFRSRGKNAKREHHEVKNIDCEKTATAKKRDRRHWSDGSIPSQY